MNAFKTFIVTGVFHRTIIKFWGNCEGGLLEVNLGSEDTYVVVGIDWIDVEIFICKKYCMH